MDAPDTERKGYTKILRGFRRFGKRRNWRVRHRPIQLLRFSISGRFAGTLFLSHTPNPEKLRPFLSPLFEEILSSPPRVAISSIDVFFPSWIDTRVLALTASPPPSVPLSVRGDAPTELATEGSDAPQASSAPPPMFDAIATYSTTLITSGDPVDIYYPDPATLGDGRHAFPIALFLQGANVDKVYYAQYAKTVARYGFIVVVPNHRTSILGRAALFAQVSQVPEALASLRMTSDRAPFAEMMDAEKLVLLGHSHGGMMGLDAIRGACDIPFCVGDYSIPEELVAAAFFGTFLWEDGEYLPIDNADVPIALIAGTRDSLITPQEILGTYKKIDRPPKVFVLVKGSNHYGITDVDNPPGSPQEPNRQTLDRSAGIETIARWSALFLRAHALGDRAAFDYIYKTKNHQDTNVKVVSQP